MTDLTDQDRRQLREDAKAVINKTAMRSSAAVSIAQYVLATVDAPAPTLAEELRAWAEDASYDEDRDNLLRAASRADQMEHDLADASAEVEQAERRADEWHGIAQRYYAKVELLTADLAEVRAEVERLTAERNPNGSAAQLERDGDAPSQVVLDPADVKPGEAWTVECRGERRTAVKDSDDNVEPWNTFNAAGLYFTEDNEDITLITRLVPAPRVITNADELERLAVKSVVLDGVKRSCHKASDESWRRSDGMTLGSSQCLSHGPATVLWEPEA